jgi:hypothetical protein
LFLKADVCKFQRLIDLRAVVQLPTREVAIPSAFAGESFEYTLEQCAHISSG